MAIEVKTPHLARFLKGNSLEGPRQKGIKLFSLGNCDLKKLDVALSGEAEFKVKAEDKWSNLKYKVKIEGFMNDQGVIRSSCNCPYDYGGICKHRVAAIFTLDQLILANPTLKKKYEMLDSKVYMPVLEPDEIKINTSAEAWKTKNSIKKVSILSAQDGVAEVEISYKSENFSLRFSRESDTQIQTSCSCKQDLDVPLCEHKAAALLLIREQFGRRAFEMMRDFTDEKNVLLAEYGFKVSDDLKNKFEFKTTDDGTLKLALVDPSIHKLSQHQDWQQLTKRFIKPLQEQTIAVAKEEELKEKRVLIFSLDQQDDNGQVADVVVRPLGAKLNLKTGKMSNFTSLEYNRTVADIPPIDELDGRTMQLSKQLESNGLAEYLRKQKQVHVNFWGVPTAQSLSEEAVALGRVYLGKVWDKIMPNLAKQRVFVSPDTHHQVSKMIEVTAMPERLRVHFELYEEKEFIVFEPHLDIHTEKVALSEFKRVGYWLYLLDTKLYKTADYSDSFVLEYFTGRGKIKVRKENFTGFFHDFVVPLAAQFDVDFNVPYEFIDQPITYQKTRLYLKEDEESLMFVPAYVYTNPQNEELEFANDGRSNRVGYEDDQIVVMNRNADLEEQAHALLMAQHPDFEFQQNDPFFYLPFAGVLKNNWLFTYFDALKEADIEVFGFKSLKNFKYNANRPVMKIRSSSGIDWFDMQMEVQFGDQYAKLSDLKKALLNKQNYVQLKDGTLGLLPEEWLQRYSQLFKFGTAKGDNIQISKLHFNVIDALTDEIDNEEILREIAEKKQKLLNFKEIPNIKLPSNVKATLRDYQNEGYKWLHFLDEFGWGGCLADDMGLGKTLQMLTFLQEQKNRLKNVTNLVVVPTSLIFNWEAEAEKFTPELKLFVYRGAARQKDVSYFKEYDIILSTYGTVRSDVELLSTFRFNYVILDESQAIKNPDSLISKAVRLLQARNRLVMTGTPVENNTFDLYSQMQFLNPGLLTSQEFFKSEYATPIDKHQDADKAAELRKLVYPFILKRTKKQVAKDLPDKTETILYCEMGKKQRKVYDTMRETYRQKIVEKMSVEGKEKSSFLILEGLLKLRQICDSPALLSDDADYGNDSAKLDELTRELEENASDHKILIFSQFIKMLDLIKGYLEKHNITYEYLDGQTQDRGRRVNRFQNDKSCRVFLISLKAGGVGLNLTEADYVYLVDPWWNPAVEQQAIDRTHRIGQNKKVFAYKMICKDSIEEKILLLQAKKKSIADDLISAEAGFLKALSKDDIVNLFS